MLVRDVNTENMKKEYPNLEGKKAPAFCLPDHSGQEVCLKDVLAQGKDVLLFFYPRDMTSGCTVETQAFSAAKRRFGARGVRVFGVSKLSVESKQKFRQKSGITVDLLADEELEVAQKYGVWREKNMYGKKVMGIARETFLIGAADGRIIKHWQKVKPATHVDEVLAFLATR